MPNLHETLTRQLQEQHRRFLPLSPIDQNQVHIRFPGRFLGNNIVWDAQLKTLRSLYEEFKLEGNIAPETALSLRQYIHIHSTDKELIPITVALNVPQFDEPTILKTIIMIHNYRRLRAGRHEYGEPVLFQE